jgi:DNA-binding transcriptional MocR family regulator
VALQYSATEGYRPLRELIAQRMTDEGVAATVDNILVTTGSQQAIDLVGKILLDRVMRWWLNPHLSRRTASLERL